MNGLYKVTSVGVLVVEQPILDLDRLDVGWVSVVPGPG